MTRLLAFCLALTAGCCNDKVTAAPATPKVAASHPDGASPPARLRVTNHCEVDIWLAQQNFPGAALVHLDKGAHQDYQIPAEGLASTRFWPKIFCDSTGNDCKIGQSGPPCPAKGCSPPVDSKLEATWGCTLADKSKCAFTPQGVQMIDTFWNASAVDGYTLPFTMTVSGGDGRASCKPADCSGLAKAICPIDDNLSDNGKNPKYAKQDLRVSGAGGCFSPCTKLNYPGFGGDGLNAPGGPVELLYCCPGAMSSACRAGPVVGTKYVKLIHDACKNSVYGYAYDDGVGLRQCSGDTVIEFTVGPGCVEINAK